MIRSKGTKSSEVYFSVPAIMNTLFVIVILLLVDYLIFSSNMQLIVCFSWSFYIKLLVVFLYTLSKSSEDFSFFFKSVDLNAAHDFSVLYSCFWIVTVDIFLLEEQPSYFNLFFIVAGVLGWFLFTHRLPRIIPTSIFSGFIMLALTLMNIAVVISSCILITYTLISGTWDWKVINLIDLIMNRF